MLKLYNLIDTLGVLILICGQLAEEPAMVVEELAAVAEEPTTMADDPAWPAEDPIRTTEKSIEDLFNKAYTKDLIPKDVLGQLCRGQT